MNLDLLEGEGLEPYGQTVFSLSQQPDWTWWRYTCQRSLAKSLLMWRLWSCSKQNPTNYRQNVSDQPLLACTWQLQDSDASHVPNVTFAECDGSLLCATTKDGIGNSKRWYRKFLVVCVKNACPWNGGAVIDMGKVRWKIMFWAWEMLSREVEWDGMVVELEFDSFG